MKLSCFATDLDGTLLTNAKTIDPDVIQKIRILKEKGIPIVLISGRHLFDILPYAKELSLSERDYLIAGDGAYLYTGTGKKKLAQNLISLASLCRLIASGENRIDIVTNRGDFYLSPKISRREFFKTLFRTKESNRKIKKIEIAEKQLSLLHFCKIEKVFLKDTGFKKGVLPASETLSEFSVIPYEAFCELLAPKAGKWNALNFLSEHGYIGPLSELLFCGDSYNDLECFTKLPNTVAVENAAAEVLEKASYITKSNEENGVGLALMHFFNFECCPFADEVFS